MKIQFLITCLVVLFAIGTAKPVERRGLGDTIKGTVKTVQNILNHGIGTFFDPVTEGGSQGACGPYANKASQIVAIVSRKRMNKS
jgi:hypothetical protein